MELCIWMRILGCMKRRQEVKSIEKLLRKQTLLGCLRERDSCGNWAVILPSREAIQENHKEERKRPAFCKPLHKQNLTLVSSSR